MKGICVIFIDPDLFFRISQGMLPWQPILGKLGKMTFIQHAGVSKRIRISQFRFTCVKWQYFCYILCYFDKDQSSNPGDYKSKNCTFSDEMEKKSAYLTKYI